MNFTHAIGTFLRASGIRTLFDKLWPSIRWRMWRMISPIYNRRWEIFCWLATCYRTVLLRRVVFIGVTGSCGKTTTKEIAAAVLSSKYKGRRNFGNNNFPLGVAKTIFHVRPWDKFCIQEVSVGVSGEPALEESIRMVKPRIGVVTNIGADHLSAFGTMEHIAAEKGKLIAALPPTSGTAILNADDEHVIAMRGRFTGQLITFGLAPVATIRAENISCNWPERLSFTIHYAGQSLSVQTQLCGTHWVHSVLAAIAVGIAMGLPLATAVQAAQMTPPFRGRLSPVMHPDGITFMRDDIKAPLWTIPPALDFLKQARAKRKIAVIGTLSDYQGDAAGQYVKVARQALEVADYVFFVGRWASRCLRARRHPQDDAVRAFSKVEDVSQFLQKFLEPGDLVLLKGRLGIDNLEKIINACSSTSLKRRTSNSITHPNLNHPDTEESQIDSFPSSLSYLPTADLEQPFEVVVGLGNPGEQYQNTRHNVGQRVVDLIANADEAEWVHGDQAMVAQIERQGKTVYLVKTLTKVNNTGQVLLQLADQIGFRPSQCILVYDDLDLALGDVRLRTKGSAGGHNGVRSIIDTFQNENFRRIKIGIGRPERKDQITEYVLQEFTPSERSTIEQVYIEAAERILTCIARN